MVINTVWNNSSRKVKNNTVIGNINYTRSK